MPSRSITPLWASGFVTLLRRDLSNERGVAADGSCHEMKCVGRAADIVSGSANRKCAAGILSTGDADRADINSAGGCAKPSDHAAGI